MNKYYLTGGLFYLALLQELNRVFETHVRQSDAVSLTFRGLSLIYGLVEQAILVIALHEVGAAVLDNVVQIVAICSKENCAKIWVEDKISVIGNVMLDLERCNLEWTDRNCEVELQDFDEVAVGHLLA